MMSSTTDASTNNTGTREGGEGGGGLWLVVKGRASDVSCVCTLRLRVGMCIRKCACAFAHLSVHVHA